MSTKPQLITYVDRLAGDLVGLDRLLRDEFAGAFDGVHLLPFYPPIDGSDAGFDPVDHTAVDARLGSWDDVGRIGAGRRVMADLIVNHVSCDSAPFRDWQVHGATSPYDGMFLTREQVFPDGATPDQLDRIYRPRPGPPFTAYEIAGDQREIWTTFTSEQIDLDVGHPAAWDYLMSVLDRFEASGVDLVRLDAIGYAIKRADTTCFMIPECFDFIDDVTRAARDRGMAVLVEIRAHHRFQVEVAMRVDRVYDFALPALVLYALHRCDARPLVDWLTMAPRNCVTVLDTHDGIGIADVAAEGEEAGLLRAEQISDLVAAIHDASGQTSVRAERTVGSGLGLYQINCALYDALGRDDDAHFVARLIQVLVPGIPQVYYGGLLASPNQTDLLRQTDVGRDINRPYYNPANRATALSQPVVQATLGLLRWRSANDEVFTGRFSCVVVGEHGLHFTWVTDDRRLEAGIDLGDRTFVVSLDGASITDMEGF